MTNPPIDNLEALGRICPIVADDHLLIAQTFLGEFTRQFKPRGVIHVGAHRGQEVALYRKHGFKRILLIEANPDWVTLLRDRHADDRDVQVIHGAATSVDGPQTLHLHTSRSGSNEPASLLQLKEFKEIVKTLHTPDSIEVPGFRLDTLFASGIAHREEFNFLVLDIQGAELLALQGAVETLPHLDAVQAEAAVIEMYAGGASFKDLQDFFAASGKTLSKGVLHELYNEKGRFPAWGEFYFSRPV